MGMVTPNLRSTMVKKGRQNPLKGPKPDVCVEPSRGGGVCERKRQRERETERAGCFEISLWKHCGSVFHDNARLPRIKNSPTWMTSIWIQRMFCLRFLPSPYVVSRGGTCVVFRTARTQGTCRNNPSKNTACNPKVLA